VAFRISKTYKAVIIGAMLLCIAYVEFSGPGVLSDRQRGDAAPVLDERLLFQPAKYPDGNWQPADLEYENVTIISDDGTKLHGWFCAHEAPIATILYIHGNAGNITHRAAVLRRLQSEHHASVLIFDYRGYGRSEGVPTIKGAIDDATAARSELARLATIDESDVVIMGRSLGGAIAIQLAAEEECRGLILESTFSSLKSLAKRYFPGSAALVPENNLNSAAAIKKHKGPLLQSHGERDTIIPFASGIELFEAANKPKQFIRIPNANHNHPQSPAYYKSLDAFLRNLPATSE